MVDIVTLIDTVVSQDHPAILIQIETLDFLNMALARLENCLHFPYTSQLKTQNIGIMVARRSNFFDTRGPGSIGVIGHVHFLAAKELEVVLIHLAIEAVDLGKQKYATALGTDGVVLELRRQAHTTLSWHIGPSHSITLMGIQKCMAHLLDSVDRCRCNRRGNQLPVGLVTRYLIEGIVPVEVVVLNILDARQSDASRGVNQIGRLGTS